MLRDLNSLALIAVSFLFAISPQCLWAQFGLTASPDLLPFLAPTDGKTLSASYPQELTADPLSQFQGEPYRLPSASPAGLGPIATVEGDFTPVAARPPQPLPQNPPTLMEGPYTMVAPAGQARVVAQENLVQQMFQEAPSQTPRPLPEASPPPCPDHPQGRQPCFLNRPYDPLREWSFEAAGLILGRNDPNRVWFSYQSNNNANEIMNSEQARTSWQGGWYATVSRSFQCDAWRLEGTYWGLAPMRGDASVTHPQYVSSTLMFTDVVYANPNIPGLPEDLFTGAFEQALWRTNEIHNAEINLLRHRIPWEGYRLGVDWLVGVRYFRFDERLTYGSKRYPGPWGTIPELEGYLSDRVENNLIGVQLGFDVRWPVSDCLVLSCRPKVGLYNNHIQNLFQAYRGDGELFAPNPNPPVGDPVPGQYPVRSSDDRFSVLSEIEARLTWQVTPRLSAFVGYRLVAVSEIALADEQYPFYVVDIVDAIEHIDSNGDLILHGGVAGITFAF